MDIMNIFQTGFKLNMLFSQYFKTKIPTFPIWKLFPNNDRLDRLKMPLETKNLKKFQD